MWRRGEEDWQERRDQSICYKIGSSVGDREAGHLNKARTMIALIDMPLWVGKILMDLPLNEKL